MDASTELQLEPLLDRARALATQAADRILDVYKSDFSVTQKQDKSPLTQADLASHTAICEGLRQLAPTIPILSEESAHAPFAERSKWHQYWLVDPLDGTKEFVKRNGEFTVNIALIEGNGPVLGVVHVPVSGNSYFAARGVGSFILEAGKNTPQPLRTRKVDPSKIVVCGSRSHGSDAIQTFIHRLPGEVEFISQGSSLKLCLIAEGRADVYPRFGPTSEWDTAAAQCVVEQAGGRVLDLQFEPLIYNSKDSVLNPFFVVIGDTSYAWREVIDAAGTA
jgi:3'(2'), 5'-bisphosphate nucleotidase